MDIKKLSLELAAIAMIADAAKKRKDELRAQLQAEMDGIGADRVKAELDGEVIAYVTTSKPKFKWEVISERKFVEWVKDNHPSEIVESVRESFREVILDKFNYVDDAAIDPNGEIVDWLVGHISEPYLVTKFHSDGREKLRDAFVSNSIDPKKVLEIE
ncbi:MAG: hypothetical protein ACOVQZ_00585 [Candidatus Nanopelagicaceae bacterium]